MARKKTPDQLFWEAKDKQQIREKYKRFLIEEGKENTPDSTHLFAIKVIAGGHDYMGMKEGDLILFLAGGLPYTCD